MTKKRNIIYSIISLCAIAAYCGFLVKNTIEEVDIVEETLPHEEIELDSPKAFIEPTENILMSVSSSVEKVEHLKEEATKPLEEPSSAPEGFSPIMPANGSITSAFSLKHTFSEHTQDWRTHPGIDITAPLASSVYAVEDGTVVKCSTDTLWGNIIEIDHGEYISIYKNVSTLIMVKEGDNVTRGEKISGIGEKSAFEGKSPHLHFELIHFNEYIDPIPLIG